MRKLRVSACISGDVWACFRPLSARAVRAIKRAISPLQANGPCALHAHPRFRTATPCVPPLRVCVVRHVLRAEKRAQMAWDGGPHCFRMATVFVLFLLAFTFESPPPCSRADCVQMVYYENQGFNYLFENGLKWHIVLKHQER